jgi:predicted DNA-binding transcriptional regulator YafY
VVHLHYLSNRQYELTLRDVEPIGLFYYSAAWHLIAWCRLRNGFRDFRSDCIRELKPTGEIFTPRSISTMQEYFSSLQQANAEMQAVTVLFDRKDARYVHNSKHYFGFVSEEESEGQVKMKFLTSDLHMLARWLISYGRSVDVESPESLRGIIQNLVEELQEHYLKLAGS